MSKPAKYKITKSGLRLKWDPISKQYEVDLDYLKETKHLRYPDGKKKKGFAKAIAEQKKKAPPPPSAAKGLTVESYNEYLLSAWWRVRRLFKLQSVWGKCELCGEKATEVHHLNYKNLGRESMKDLQAICHECHKKQHGITDPSA